jgi:hypothetical protein
MLAPILAAEACGMTGVSGVASYVHPHMHANKPAPAQQNSDEEGDYGPSARDLRQAPVSTPPVSGSINLLA